MRIAVLGPTFPIRGGISHYTTLLVEHLRKRHEVLFVSYRKQYPDFLYPGRSQIDSSQAALSTDCERIISFMNPLSWVIAEKRIAAFQPELVIFSWVSPALAMQFRLISGRLRKELSSSKILFLCHNIRMHEKRKIDSILSRIAFANAHHFIVHGEESKKSLEGLVGHSDISVISHPTYLPLAQISREGTLDSKRKLGIPPDAKVVLFFGFVRPYKGLEILLKAIPEAASKIENLFLLVVGEFWESRKTYEKLIDELGIREKVLIVDRYIPNEEISSYFSAADIVALPYVDASGSGVVQLSYGFEKPVITTRVGDIENSVKHGKTGFLVEPKNPSALACSIVDFFEAENREEMSSNIRKAMESFSWNTIVDCIESVARD
ncbi:MAG: glycosyltransferase [Actinomycetota bacterium]|nr:glycosyltransferase [Actinomycetota bacterium]